MLVRAGAADGPRIWVAWETQRRNATLSRALGCSLFEFDLPYRGTLRYITATLLTLMTFLRESPGLIFVQSPSMVLATLAVSYGKVFRIPVVVDSHNAAIEPLGRSARWQASLARFILRHASLVILTNDALAARVSTEPGIAPIAVLPDPVPNLRHGEEFPVLSGRRNVLYMCSWAEDEPYREVIGAARLLPKDTVIYMTGRSGGRLDDLDEPLPSNVVLTGFVAEEEYVRLLHAADLVLDLTTWQDCLLCGAYEAVAAERPMVLSGTTALRSYFRRGAVYTDNTPDDIARRIQDALSATEVLTEEVRTLKQELAATWQTDFERLEVQLRRLTAVRSTKNRG